MTWLHAYSHAAFRVRVDLRRALGVSAETALSLDESPLVPFLRLQADWPDRGRAGLRAGQHGAVEDGVAKIGSAKIRVAKIGTMQIRPLKRGPVEVSPG